MFNTAGNERNLFDSCKESLPGVNNNEFSPISIQILSIGLIQQYPASS